MTSYIEDGYNLNGYVAATPESKSGERLWDGLEFTFRPATRSEIVRLDAEIKITMVNDLDNPESAVKSERIGSEFVAKHLQTWDLRNSKDEPVPCNVAAIGRLHPGLFDVIYKIIRGMRTSDPRPEMKFAPISDAELLGNSSGVSGLNSDTP